MARGSTLLSLPTPPGAGAIRKQKYLTQEIGWQGTAPTTSARACVIAALRVSSPDVPTVSEDAAVLLHAIWQKHVLPARERMNAEVSQYLLRTAAGSINTNVGSPVLVQWDIRRRHVEGAIRAVALEFEARAPPDATVRRYLLSEGVATLGKLAGAEFRLTRDLPLDSPARTQGALVHLETVAEAELRVVASSAKFAGEEPATPAMSSLTETTGLRAILDTNVWMHGKRPDEVPWHDLLGVPAGELIALVVPAIVVRELDKHKAEHRQERLRRRAGERLLWLKEVAQAGGRVRNDVSLVLRPREPRVNYRAEHLDPSVPDDRLLAAALEVQREGPADPVVVVTIDVGLSLKAPTHGIAVFELPEAHQLAGGPDADRKTIQDLEARLQAAVGRRAHLELTFQSSDLHTHLAAPLVKRLSDEDRALERAAAEARVREYYVLPFGRNSEFTKTQQQVYLGAFDEHLDVVGHLRDLAARTVPVTLRLRNTGTTPATDIEVRLAVRNGPALLSAEPVPPDPKPPDLDQGSLAAHMMNMERQTLLKRVVARELAPGTPILNLPLPRLKHHQHVDVTVFATFPAPDQVRPFGLTFAISCVEDPDLRQGELHVVVEPRAPESETPSTLDLKKRPQ